MILDFEHLSQKGEGVKAIQPEGIASKLLVESLLARMNDNEGPVVQTVRTDGHIENAEMMKSKLYGFRINSKRARKGILLGPTS